MSNVKNGFEQTTGDGDDNAPFIEGELVPSQIDFVISAGGANESDVTIVLNDGHGDRVNSPLLLNIWLSDDSGGGGLTATSASGTVQAKSASGVDFAVLTAKKALVVQSTATGLYVLEINDTAKTGFFIAVQNPFSGLNVVSRQLVGGDYG